MIRRSLCLWTASLLFGVLCLPARAEQEPIPPRNVIILIGDGMGFEQVRAAGMFISGAPGTLFFESFQNRGQVVTRSADADIPDSAATATAMATGHKVNNTVVSVALPGDGRDLPTVLEHFKRLGKSTGLVTTTFLTHATPAAFGAHSTSRYDFRNIAQDYLNDSRPNMLFGGAEPAGEGLTDAAARAAGYAVVTTRDEMRSLRPGKVTHVVGLFGQGYLPYEWEFVIGLSPAYDGIPHLSETTATALDILADNPKGFFLMVEGGRIDHACHANAIEATVFETLAFERAAKRVAEWADGRDDTLIIVTADHETGGLTVRGAKGPGRFPDATWSTTAHTAAPVPIYAWGVGAERVSGVIDNTDVFRLMMGEPLLPPASAASREETKIKIPVAGD